jgi:hypothetical protein
MDKRLKSFIAKMKKDKIPCIFVGLITKKDGKPNFLEVVISRPEKYDKPLMAKILKKIPKTYKGIKVNIV